MSAEDNSCDESGMNQCFYYTNMTPQPHHFNAGVWKSLEKQEQAAAKSGTSMFIYVGSLGKAKTIGVNRVVVPKYMWKLIYYLNVHRYEAYLFPNTTTTTQPYSQYRITIAQLQQRAGIKFNGQLFKWTDN
jgi:endonuclease G